MQRITKIAIIGVVALVTTVVSETAARADFLGRVIVNGVTNQAITSVTENQCQNATGAGQVACAVPETIVDVRQTVNNTVDQTVQQACQNASGVGEDACSAVQSVNSFKKEISEQVRGIRLFGGSRHSQDSSTQDSQTPSTQDSQTPSTQDSQTPSVQDSQTPSVQDSQTPSVQDSQTPSNNSQPPSSVPSGATQN